MTKNKTGKRKNNFTLLLFVGLLHNTKAKDLGPDGGEAVVFQSRVPVLSENQTNSENVTDHLARGKELVDEALIPVYDMVNFFLEDIVQQNDLNYMEERGVDFSNLDAIVDSFENDYEEWMKYAIGKICRNYY